MGKCFLSHYCILEAGNTLIVKYSRPTKETNEGYLPPLVILRVGRREHLVFLKHDNMLRMIADRQDAAYFAT